MSKYTLHVGGYGERKPEDLQMFLCGLVKSVYTEKDGLVLTLKIGHQMVYIYDGKYPTGCDGETGFDIVITVNPRHVTAKTNLDGIVQQFAEDVRAYTKQQVLPYYREVVWVACANA